MERVKIVKNQSSERVKITNGRTDKAAHLEGRPLAVRNVAKNVQKLRLAQLAREYASDAITTLVNICKDKEASDAARVSAANSILDRGYGKPMQAHQLAGPNNGPIMMRFERQALEKMPDETLDALQALVTSLSKGELEKITQQTVIEGEVVSSEDDEGMFR